MAKKNKGAGLDGSELELNDQVMTTQSKSQTAKAPKQSNKKSSGSEKKPNVFKRMGRFFKEMGAELKKTTWPTFPKVLKQTGIVLGVVTLFLLVILLLDSGLTALLGLLTEVGRF